MQAWKRVARTVIGPAVRRLYAFVHSVAEADLPRFANQPRNLHIELPRRLSGARYIRIGDDVKIGPGSMLSAQTRYPGEWLRRPDGGYPVQQFSPRIVIGNRVTATGGLTMSAVEEITIEDDVMFAANVFVADGSHGYAHANEPYKYQPIWRIAPVRIKHGSWIGQNAVILSGVTIGELAIVGANSVVTRDVPPRSIVAGNPARVIKYWDAATQTWRTPNGQHAAVRAAL